MAKIFENHVKWYINVLRTNNFRVIMKFSMILGKLHKNTITRATLCELKKLLNLTLVSGLGPWILYSLDQCVHPSKVSQNLDR